MLRFWAHSSFGAAECVQNGQSPIILIDTRSAASIRSNQSDDLLMPCASQQHRRQQSPSESDFDGIAFVGQKWTIDDVQNQLRR